MDHSYKEEYARTGEKECLPLNRDIRIMDNERRLRREIANSNERRRMQSINAGFQSLRTLLPSHEGEKLSKAAILQQTAEYIYNLEQEKTRLLSQNCQLKRLLNQHEGESHPTVKKRKLGSMPEDEGSVSPEPSSLSVEGETGVEGLRREVIEVRMQLERERRLRLGLEDKLRELETNIYPEGLHLEYESQEGLELDHSRTCLSDNGEAVEEMEVPLPLMVDEVDGAELLSSAVLPPVIQTQTVLTTQDIKAELEESGELDATTRLLRRLPSVIEQAIKAEPKVEVERLPTPGSNTLEEIPSRYDTSRQNLETIVEAIRHLEGDHLFSDIPSPVSPTPPTHRLQPVQDAPLALTTKHQTSQRLIKVDMNPFLKFHTTQALQHQRPGVIVVKPS